MADFHWPGPLPAPDFIMVPKLVHREILKHLSGAEFKVFYCLLVKAYEWGHADAELSVSEIAELSGVSRRMTQLTVQALEDCGLVEIIRHQSRQHGHEANTYRVMVTDDPRYIDRTPSATIAQAIAKTAPARAGTAQDRARSYKSKNSNQEGTDIHPNKYTTGRYAVCSSCGSRPCAEGCPGSEVLPGETGPARNGSTRTG